MIITKRDLTLFEKLSSYGMLSTKQIATNLFQSIATTTVLRRLRILEEHHFLKRVLGLETQENLWILTEKGAEMAGVALAKRNWSKNLLEHDHKLLSVRLELEKFGIAQSWIPEHQIRSLALIKYGLKETKNKLIPDGLMSTDNKGNKEIVAIELELTLKHQIRIRDIIKRYRDKKDLQALWYIAGSKSILKSVFNEWMKHKNFNNQISLYGSMYEEVMKLPLEAKLWGENGTYRIKDIWNALPAHSPAQRMSTNLLSPT